ncbi:MAG: hypothetical protein HYZ35_05475, partial [Chloroflexi bacterium]|nr:hypothetical protein [Chloroflexota bacterium]
PDYFGSRALSALLGTATVPLTFWAVRTLYRDHRRADLIALLSALWLSVLLWHVHWSRLGLETIAVPLFAIALLGLLAWAWQRESPWAFALAGMALGASQYANPGARVLPLEALTTFLLLAGGFRPRRLFVHGLALLLGAILVYAPLGWFFWQNPEWFISRMAFASSNVRAGGLPVYFDNAIKTLASFNFWGDVMPRHNLSGRPAFDVAASLWMFTGVGVMLFERGFWRRHLALLLALAINVLPVILSDGAPGFGRTLGAVPMLVVLPAIGAAAAFDWARGKRRLQLLLAGSLIVSAGWNLYDYFGRYPRQPGLFDSFEVGLWTLSQAAARRAAAGTGYLVLDEAGLEHPAVQLTRELTGGDLRIINGQKCFAYPAHSATDTIFGTLPQWIAPVVAQYPAAHVTDVMHEPEAYQYGGVVSVPAGQASVDGNAEPIAMFGGSFALLAATLPADPVRPGDSVPITLRWRVAEPVDTAYSTFVHLVGVGKPLVAGVDAAPCASWYPTDRWHTDEVVQYQLTLVIPSDLVAGNYEVAVGMYNWISSERLPVVQTNGREPDRAFVGSMVVK